MIRSMTAWARYDLKSEWGNATWELRSVNQRYLESDIRLPEQFRSLEPIVRNRIRARLTRGKVECSLHFEPNIQIHHRLMLNENLAKQLIKASNWVKMQSGAGEINPLDILRWPGVMTTEKQDLDAIGTQLIQALEAVLDEFIISRETEGTTLKKLIEQRLDAISDELHNVRTHMPDVIRWQRERLLRKLEDAQIQLDNTRVDQELILIAQRLDVAEELDRLEMHVQEICHTLQKKEAVGRRLDFIIQELNREANTLASKSINIDITHSAIELKVLIEQMREQIQNIE